MKVIQKIKETWKELDKTTREWLVACGIWTLDGVLAGSIITSGIKDRKAAKEIQKVRKEAYIEGKMDAYQAIVKRCEVSPYPYKKLDNYNPMKKH